YGNPPPPGPFISIEVLGDSEPRIPRTAWLICCAAWLLVSVFSCGFVVRVSFAVSGLRTVFVKLGTTTCRLSFGGSGVGVDLTGGVGGVGGVGVDGASGGGVTSCCGGGGNCAL